MYLRLKEHKKTAKKRAVFLSRKSWRAMPIVWSLKSKPLRQTWLELLNSE